MKPKLDQLVPHSEQAKIEATLAKKVPPPPSPAEVEAHDLAYQRRMRKDHGLRKTSPGRYLDWPKGTKGVQGPGWLEIWKLSGGLEPQARRKLSPRRP